MKTFKTIFHEVEYVDRQNPSLTFVLLLISAFTVQNKEIFFVLALKKDVLYFST